MLTLVCFCAFLATPKEDQGSPDPARFGDFAAYWIAGRCIHDGNNPYETSNVSAIANDLDLHQAFVTWNPPWTLLPFIPLASVPFHTAALIWLAVNIALVLWVGIVAGRSAGWNAFHATLLTMTFVPVAVCLGMSQLSILTLAAFVAYREAMRVNRPVLAGAYLALASVKPHLALLMWLAAAITGTTRQRWRVAIGFTATIGLLAIAISLQHPVVFSQYLAALQDPPASAPTNYFAATPARWLRWLVESSLDHSKPLAWLSYLPLFLSTWVIIRLHAITVRDDDDRFQTVLVLSVFSLPYGWHYDQVLFLPPYLCLCAAARNAPREHWRLTTCLILTQTCFALMLWAQVPESWYALFSITFAAIWLAEHLRWRTFIQSHTSREPPAATCAQKIRSGSTVWQHSNRDAKA